MSRGLPLNIVPSFKLEPANTGTTLENRPCIASVMGWAVSSTPSTTGENVMDCDCQPNKVAASVSNKHDSGSDDEEQCDRKELSNRVTAFLQGANKTAAV